MVETPRRKRTFRRPSVIPGFGLSFGYTLTCLGLVVLLPLAGLVAKASGLGLSGIWYVA
ncbi:molybdate ABC transporter permease subunit, partial [Halomonas sp. ATBC28]